MRTNIRILFVNKRLNFVSKGDGKFNKHLFPVHSKTCIFLKNKISKSRNYT